MKRINLLILVFALGAFVIVPSNTTFAHGLVDQSHLVSGGAQLILAHTPIGQEFTPSQTNLVAVDIQFRSSGMAGTGTITVNIRRGNIFSPILASTSKVVSACQGSSCIEHFDFPDILQLIPGEKYVIEVQATSPIHAWEGSGLNSYSGGAAIIQGSVFPDSDYGFQTYYQSAIGVEIDIKPGSRPNSINCKNENGVIPLAILTTDSFDATKVDHASVRFEGASEVHKDKRTGIPIRHMEDIDGDGDMDLVFHFRRGDTSLTCDSTVGRLVGKTYDGLEIHGFDSVQMVPRK